MVYSSKKLINIIPLKKIPELFVNYNIIKIDENGLVENINKKKSNKVIFNLVQEHNSPSNGYFLTSGNNNNENNKIDNNEYKKEDFINNDITDADIIFVNNKVETKLVKSISLFFIQFNNITNQYILTSLVDDVFFALEISSNKNFYLEDCKRYYIQLCDTILSVLPNNIDKNIKIKLLNSNKEEKNNNKFIFNFNALPIKIGRTGCNININKNSISKVHLIVNYDTNINQFYVKDNCSTNRSLILLKKGKEVILEDKMFFFLEKEHFILKR